MGSSYGMAVVAVAMVLTAAGLRISVAVRRARRRRLLRHCRQRMVLLCKLVNRYERRVAEVRDSAQEYVTSLRPEAVKALYRLTVLMNNVHQAVLEAKQRLEVDDAAQLEDALAVIEDLLPSDLRQQATAGAHKLSGWERRAESLLKAVSRGIRQSRARVGSARVPPPISGDPDGYH